MLHHDRHYLRGCPSCDHGINLWQSIMEFISYSDTMDSCGGCTCILQCHYVCVAVVGTGGKCTTLCNNGVDCLPSDKVVWVLGGVRKCDVCKPRL